MIKVEGLTKKYAGVTAVEDLNFEVEKGEIVGFLGPNGAGKSTTMRILSCYLPATSGRATVAGIDVARAKLLGFGISSAIAGIALGILAYVSGRVDLSNFLDIMYLPGTGELAVYSAAMVGACFGFMWYNTYPAEVFMGDTGSLALGGSIAALALMVHKELLLPILGGIFVMETLSVILQTTYFKYTKKRYGEGKRLFLMAPIHHHFEKKGWKEPKIVVRFWIIAILLAVFTIISLKLR
jgi:phospho-N-acetylmuramoyl-pentapeptide-transferase